MMMTLLIEAMGWAPGWMGVDPIIAPRPRPGRRCGSRRGRNHGGARTRAPVLGWPRGKRRALRVAYDAGRAALLRAPVSFRPSFSLLPPVSPVDVLQQVFGYAAFRGQQQAIVEHVAGGGDALVLMPTGGGKS